ncbi:MAG: DNA repair protein RecO [Chlamydiae bacterium]|nr:DNA repair protein RecO [Chlamydiota bacterium]
MDALILKATPYEEDGKILKVFTKDAGLISVIVKKLRRKETFWQTLTSPLARGEFHLTRRQSDLYAINEASLIDAHFEIRNDLNKLDAACSILRAILFSQYPEKPSPELYQLTIIYLKKLKTFLHPINLSTSFQMKLLNYEGLFPETKEESVFNFTSDEWLILECLCHAKTFDLLESVTVSPELEAKARELFNSRISDFIVF